MTEFRRGDVVLVAFHFVAGGATRRKRRPAVVVQADRYNRRRAAVILAAITSTRAHRALPCMVEVQRDTPEGRGAGLRTDSVVDCQTLVTISRDELVARLGRFPADVMARVDRAMENALGLPGAGEVRGGAGPEG